MVINEIDRAVIEKVLDNEVTCRLMLKHLQNRGLKMEPHFDTRFLSHAEVKAVLIECLDQIEKREMT